MMKSMARAPSKLIAILALVFFAAETAVMFFFPLLPAMPAWFGNLLDAGLMTILASPALYYLLLRPMEWNVEEVENQVGRLASIIETSPESIVITGMDGIIDYVNRGWEQMTGWGSDEVVGKVTPRVLRSDRTDPAQHERLWRTITQGRTFSGEFINRRKDGILYVAESIIMPLKDAAGRITGFSGVERDITERRQMVESLAKSEAQLRQSQKMESVGRLAGGVAHDFNNILTAINGYGELVLNGLSEGDAKREDIKEILAAGERATKLTRQLLAFSRKQILNPRILDLNAAVGATVNMLKRLIGEDIKLETRLTAQPCLVKVDAGQIEQVFLNLAVNARDAMPQGGTLAFETGIVTVTEDFSVRYPDLPRGPLVCLSVRDTGCGMTDEVKAHIFEPFFTTKEQGKGTGLGLSMVFGIIKQSGGEIEVESAPGRGTAFRIYFPQTDAQTQKQDEDEDEDNNVAPRGNETVLLVDDEDIICRLGARVLSAHGYTVLTAAGGQEALKVVERHGRPVDLLITDVVMPGMSGRELARSLAAKNMVRRTLYISGYTDDAIVQHGVLEPGLAFLYKPFLPVALLRKLRAVLDGPADQAKA